MSHFLQKEIGDLHLLKEFNKRLVLIDRQMPKWETTIKGNDLENKYPARDFFEKDIPIYLNEYQFIQQLIIPEVYFTDIIEEYNKKFAKQQVDFYLPQAKMVIEIDGQQHKNDDVTRINDKYRDEFLSKYGVNVIRIDTLDLYKKNQLFLKKIEEIKDRLNQFHKVLNFNILSREVSGFAKLAIEDLLLWLKNLCKLKKIPYYNPKINISYCNSESEFVFNSKDINVDFSLLRRWTDENKNNREVIYIRTDYYDRANYFNVSTSDPIKYEIVNDGQLPIIINALTCNDTIGLLPTGSGKSLCYQLTALLQPCVSFIVCPIKSLMYDQKDNLDRAYISHTNYISSDQNAETKSLIGQEFAEGKYFFIWISPERFQVQEFRDYLVQLNKEQTIALAVIDEVHCLSEWGHDFRTSYLNLVKTIRNYCPSAWFLGLTATASSFVLEDLKVEFNIEPRNIKTLTSFTRPELKFYVRKDISENQEDKKRILYDLLSELNNKHNIFGDATKSGLIFTLFKNGKFGCYKLTNEISTKFKVDAKWYCGEVPMTHIFGMGLKNASTPVMKVDVFDKYKMKVQKDYKNNGFPLLVSTKAFGMGIDK